MNMRVRRGKHWLIQTCARWAGPLNFGIHISLRGCKYIDIHLPYTVITLGCISEVEYPRDWCGCARDIRAGVKYHDGSHE